MPFVGLDYDDIIIEGGNQSGYGEKKIFRIGADKRIGWQQCSFFSYEMCSIEIKGILGGKKT